MSVPIPSDEVAEDYKKALEDLTTNQRYEISNLTVIAKENTEHAMAISRVLKNHIKHTMPDRKLPALYVLDSVVKNVGTPYTLFLGQDLYDVFMTTYTLVNAQVRKKLDEMLKTWKEPVPGAGDNRPVFPPETTRPIETALIKARTAAVQSQQQHEKSQFDLLSRGRPQPTPPGQWRNTPPPNMNGRYTQPPIPHYPQQQGPNGFMQPRQSYPQYPSYPGPQQPAPQPYQQTFQQPTPYSQAPQYFAGPQQLDSLHRDIDALFVRMRQDFATNPHDQTLQLQLKALLDLQTILKTQQLPPDQLQAIRNQVNALSTATQPNTQINQPLQAPTPYSAPPVPISPAVHSPHPYPSQTQPPPLPSHMAQSPSQTPHTTDLNALLSSNTLASLLASATKPTPQPSQTPPIISLPTQPPPSVAHTTSPAEGPSSLIASLRAAGILPADANTPINGNPLPPQLASLLPPQTTSALRTPPIGSAKLAQAFMQNDVELNSASLKRSRPQLIVSLYTARPNQCSTCGKRFLATEEGRKKKARHLDWHFRTNQRLADSAKRGQSRSWYLDELEWIKSRETNEEEEDMANGVDVQKLQAVNAAKNDPKNKYIPVPSDPALANAPCPICQEKFDQTFHTDAQDWVWMDAIKIGSRVYHASCHAEVKKEGGNTPLRTATPDSVLGKRKAGLDDLHSGRSKTHQLVLA